LKTEIMNILQACARNHMENANISRELEKWDDI